MSNMKYPSDAHDFIVLRAKECNLTCLRECSCSAYAYDDSRRLCSVWYGDLLSLQQLSDDSSNGDTIHVRFAASELPDSRGNIISGKKRLLLLVIVPAVDSLALLLLGCYFSHQWRKKIKKGLLKDFFISINIQG